jgi:hypothetical protein
MLTPLQWQSMTIRSSEPGDERDLRRLAQLDSARPIRGNALIAESDGTPLAAVEIGSGRAIADPFKPTRSLVDLLHLRAAQLR